MSWQQRPARRARLAGAVLLLLSAPGAQAHTTFQGLGEFGSGVLHPLTTPAHLLLLLALGLWLGQARPLRLREPAGVFAAFAAGGLLLTTTGLPAGVPLPVLIALVLAVGAAVVWAGPPPLAARLAVCGAAALALGLDSGVDANLPGLAVAKTLFATWVSLVLCVVNVAFYISLLPPSKGVQTGLRVVGSWIVAIAFLMLAFALRR